MIRSVLAACLLASIALPAAAADPVVCDTLVQSQDKARQMAAAKHYSVDFLDADRAHVFIDLLSADTPGLQSSLKTDHIAIFRKPGASSAALFLADGPCGGFSTLVSIGSLQVSP